jgi:hypothetical protein
MPSARSFFWAPQWDYPDPSFRGSSSGGRILSQSEPDRVNPTLLIMVADCAMLIMLSMDWLSETAWAWNGFTERSVFLTNV